MVGTHNVGQDPKRRVWSKSPVCRVPGSSRKVPLNGRVGVEDCEGNHKYRYASVKDSREWEGTDTDTIRENDLTEKGWTT